MNLTKLNPVVREAAIYEKITCSAPCRAYDSRLFYLISGDVSVGIEDEKRFHLSAGNLLYIPAGTKDSLKGKYLRCAVFAFDLTDENPEPDERIEPAKAEEFDSAKAHILNDSAPFDKVILLEDAEADRDKIVRLCNVATSAEGAWRAQRSAELKLILLKLAESTSEDSLPSRMVEALDDYIRENPE